MKKLPEIGNAFLEMEWDEEDKATADYRLLKGLHEDGYHPIQVGRSTFVIQQCEHGDHPQGTYALRITIHGDKDLDPTETTYYIWAGRYGMASGGIHESNKLDQLLGPDVKFVADDQYRALRQDLVDAVEALERYVGVRNR